LTLGPVLIFMNTIKYNVLSQLVIIKNYRNVSVPKHLPIGIK
jgi:hypothetical protein